MSGTKLILLGIAVLFLILTLVGSCSVVKPGYRGVRVTMGAVTEKELAEGLHFKLPLIQQIVPIEVRVNQVTYNKMSAASSSMQDVFSDVTLSYHIMPNKVSTYYKRFGRSPQDVVDIIISAKIQEIVKGTTNMYTTEELLSKRSAIRDTIYFKLMDITEKSDIVIDEFSMTNFRFSDAYQNAIEEKQVMEQRAETAQRSKEVANQEGEAKIIRARAEAESNRLKQVAITPNLIRYEEVMVMKEKWDGKLPTVTGGAIPMLNMDGGR